MNIDDGIVLNTSCDERDRPLPFLLRRCVDWLPGDAPDASRTGTVTFWMRAGLTGRAAFTSAGRDTTLSDLEVS